jgi:hypothetical protein
MWQEKKRQPPRRKPVRFEVVPAKGRWLDDADVLSLESGCSEATPILRQLAV